MRGYWLTSGRGESEMKASDAHTIDAEFVRSILLYDPVTGVFRWRADPKRIAGGLNRGYWRVFMAGRRYYGHRLAWLYVYGKWPDAMIDHIDGDGTNNSIANLRAASRHQNQANSRISKRNSSGLKGVCFDNGKWRAQIYVRGKTKWIGRFDSAADAHAAYVAAATREHGEFARAG